MSVLARPLRDYMTPRVVTVTVDDDAASADEKMRNFNLSCLAVTGRDGAPVGVVSRTDLVQIASVMRRVTGGRSALTLPPMCLGDFMSPRVICAQPSTSVSAAAAMLREHRIHRLFVEDGGKLVGVFSAKDL